MLKEFIKQRNIFRRHLVLCTFWYILTLENVDTVCDRYEYLINKAIRGGLHTNL